MVGILFGSVKQEGVWIGQEHKGKPLDRSHGRTDFIFGERLKEASQSRGYYRNLGDCQRGLELVR